MFKTSITNNFGKLLKARSEAWANQKSISYTIMVPPELAWWYYQEYGIDHEYSIPTSPTGVAFTGTTGLVIRPQVTHPGLSPSHTVNIVAASDMNGPLQSIVKVAFESGNYLPQSVDAVIKGYMEHLLEEIIEGIKEDLPGTRGVDDEEFPLQAGKLRGRSAAEVFKEKAYIVKT